MSKKSKVYILSIILFGLILIVGTYAWFTWRSSDSRLVLTVGEIDDAQVILKPYQINKEIIPVLTYEGEEYIDVEAINKNSDEKRIILYYHINNIDSELISSEFKYTILRSTDNGNTYSEYISGNFSNASNDSDLDIMDETIETNTNYKYKVYLWLDGSSSGQGSIQGKIFNGELRAEIIKSKVVVDVPEGLIPITYDVSNGTKVKTISSADSNWYNYDNKEWANAVLVDSGLTATAAYDLSGNNTTNTINGASYNSEGLSFGGVKTDYVLLPQYNISAMTNGFTMEIRFKANNVSLTAEQDLFVNYEGGGAGIFIMNGKLYAQVYDKTNSKYIDTDSKTKNIENGVEYVATLVFDGVNVKLYLDGNFMSSAVTSGTLGDPESSTHFMLGCNPNGTTCDVQFFAGVISQARMYNKALSDSEVLNNYNGNITKNNLLFNFDYKDGKRTLYKNTSGIEIPDSDILAYYVYIPRYKYKIWETGLSSSGKEQEIDIIFEDKNTPKSMGTKVSEYRTHPAFTFGDTELNGIWVGKFETGGTEIAPLIKPNIVSLRNQTVSQEFTTSRIFGTSSYGLRRNVDSHMIKNSEWGAAAYLSHSKYGRCTNGVCEEIRRNNNSAFYTGYSEVNVATTGWSDSSSNTNQFGTSSDITQPYNTEIGYKSSTTGNIYGIYDMAGGVWEHVMGVLADSSGNPRSGNTATSNSGFNGMLGDGSMYTSGTNFPDRKYYDLYVTTDSSSNSASLTLTACNGGVCYGHSFSETTNWYKDYAISVYVTNSWVVRGGSFIDGTGAGPFYFDNTNGYSYSSIGSRAALCVLN